MSHYVRDARFLITLDWTKRRVTGAVSKTNIITVNTISSMPVASGDRVRLENCGNWATGTWTVSGVSSNSINLSAPGMRSGRTFTANLDSKIFKVTQSNQGISETRNISSMFRFNHSLPGTPTLCGLQVRVQDILRQFYGNAEVKREYEVKYRDCKNSDGWQQYGPQGGYNRDRIIRAFLCTVFAESTWNPASINESSNARGLWQITPKDTNWYDESLLLNAEYNTIAALWLMWERLFKYDPNSTPSATNPFRPWEGSKLINEKYLECCNNKTQCLACKKYCGCLNCSGIN